MAWGTINNLVSERGFGFISPEEQAPSGKDLFFHRRDLQGTIDFDHLRLGQRVEFDLGRDERHQGSAKAMNIRATT
ncbi:MAG TPA: cold shock domain-containing protein [Chloroflexota bacterium]|nr:cold shock domain-containing protein [Chloroflexota bacterium]